MITGETPAQPPGGVGGACGNGGGAIFATAVIFGTGTETGCSIDQAARYGDTGGRLDEAAAPGAERWANDCSNGDFGAAEDHASVAGVGVPGAAVAGVGVPGATVAGVGAAPQVGVTGTSHGSAIAVCTAVGTPHVPAQASSASLAFSTVADAVVDAAVVDAAGAAADAADAAGAAADAADAAAALLAVIIARSCSSDISQADECWECWDIVCSKKRVVV